MARRRQAELAEDFVWLETLIETGAPLRMGARCWRADAACRRISGNPPEE
jgi:hypothetical protein